jgi:hypothetical protein
MSSRSLTAADFSEIRAVGVDETASKRRQNHITLFVDLERSRLLYAPEGPSAVTGGSVPLRT